MQRIIFRHISGSKANQVEEFQADSNNELTIGREAGVNVQYDPARDDLVSRQHAKIIRDPNNAEAYIIEDLSSRNGTFLNKKRLSGRSAIAPGDVVQLGPGGPEFQFDLDPRPSLARTREVSMADLATPSAATRVGNTFDPSSSSTSVPPSSADVKPTVGKATVERMIGETRKEGQKTTMFVGLAGLGLVALVAGLLIVKGSKTEQAVQSELDKTKQQLDSTNNKLEDTNSELTKQQEDAPLSPAEITTQNANAVAQLQVGWKLIYTPNGNQCYHQFYKDPKSGRELALYTEVEGGIEPILTTTPNNHPIGGEHTGSGFAVTSDGFMLTNRHVAACWKTAYRFPAYASPGIVRRVTGKLEVLPQAPTDWVPSETKQAGQPKQLQGGFEGRNDYFYATFPGQSSPNPARLTRVSERHDVAMIKIDTPGTVDKVEFNDNYDTIKPGDASIVLGYPGVSPGVYGMVRSQDVFNRSSKLREIPDPTVSVGNVGRILRGNEDMSKGKDLTVSLFGDAYQLTINSTGPGNSGGPVFDDKGRVTAIFFAGKSTEGTAITFAVPIRYGEELMNASGRRKQDDAPKEEDAKPADDSKSTSDAEPAPTEAQ